mmetsp:Transcript_32338/g.84946  ORF Transcript_32338/g.84946 Transcript_32338/m.84946 type:complete len:86 (+) Transcript_32338:168-425(+)
MALHGVWEKEYESGDIDTKKSILDSIIRGNHSLGAPRCEDAAVQKYIQNFNQYIKYPYKHHVGQYEEVEEFDVQVRNTCSTVCCI